MLLFLIYNACTFSTFTFTFSTSGKEGRRIQDKCIEGIIYIQLSEMEEKYAHMIC